MYKIVGIDPGLNGGIAFFTDFTLVNVIPMPISEKKFDIKKFTSSIKRFKPEVVFLEKVHAMPTDGISSAFKFGFINGVTYGILSVLKIPIVEVTPQKWKKYIFGKLGLTKKDSIEKAKELFPEEKFLRTQRSKKMHDGMCEAALIGFYGCLTYIKKKREFGRNEVRFY